MTSAKESSSPRPSRGIKGRLLDGLLVVLAVCAAGYLLHQKDTGPPEGDAAVAFDLPLVGERGRASFAGSRERPLLVEAFASWCTACRRSSSIMEGLRDATERGQLDILLVSVDDSAAAALGAKRSWPIGLPVAFDDTGAFQRAYRISVLPTYVLIAPDGRILDVSSGPPGASTIRTWLHAGDR